MPNRLFSKLKKSLFSQQILDAKEINIEKVLKELVNNEKKRITSKRTLGEIIEHMMSSKDNFNNLGKIAESLLKKNPDSILLIYLTATYLAKEEKFEEASNLISKKIVKLKTEKTKNISVKNKNLVALLKIWRILDLISRENMKWVDGDNLKSTNYANLEFLLSDKDLEDTNLTADLTLFFAEPFLQGKHLDSYLEICKNAFNKTTNLDNKLKIIFAIRREGVRRLPNYKKNYELAINLYQSIQNEIEIFIKEALVSKTLKEVKTLRNIINVGKALNQPEIPCQAKEAIIKISTSKDGKATIWTAAFALMEENKDNYTITKKIIDSTKTFPKHMSDIQHFLEWALLAEEYTLAYHFFSKQPRKIKEARCALTYVKILQRLKRFDEAEKIAKGVHIALLSRAHNICPYTSWSLIKRVGELNFLNETAKLYSSIPQPQEPKGVIFITPRSIEQLRKTPIVVLMELKRLGWAIIPLSEGLLPLERTNNKYINKFIDVISMSRDIRRKSNLKLDIPFQSELNRGFLKWKDINLSHVIWEESAINKRVYDVDYSCPGLNKYLKNIQTITESSATVIDNIYKLKDKIGLRIGFIVQFNARLPDALYRFYCEKYGNEKDFFCIHSANGYQNYFSNFSTNISSKCVIRNMTKYPHTRSASFPLPEDFKNFYKKNKYRANEILNTVSGVTNVKRSISYVEDSIEKKAVVEYIKSWRKKGRKVVCAFGKVVYDSGVPFDGGIAHSSMKDWINHSIKTVKNSNVLLLIKPHPHELNQQISTFGNAVFKDIIEEENENTIFLDHNWFKMHDLEELIDFAIVYNGTSSIELGVMEIPTILCGYFGVVDYPVGHCLPKNKRHYELMLKGKKNIVYDKELKYKSAMWLFYMGSSLFTKNYRYHSRPVTNKVLYPPYWFKEDITNYLTKGDKNVTTLALEVIE